MSPSELIKVDAGSEVASDTRFGRDLDTWGEAICDEGGKEMFCDGCRFSRWGFVGYVGDPQGRSMSKADRRPRGGRGEDILEFSSTVIIPFEVERSSWGAALVGRKSEGSVIFRRRCNLLAIFSRLEPDRVGGRGEEKFLGSAMLTVGLFFFRLSDRDNFQAEEELEENTSPRENERRALRRPSP